VTALATLYRELGCSLCSRTGFGGGGFVAPAMRFNSKGRICTVPRHGISRIPCKTAGETAAGRLLNLETGEREAEGFGTRIRFDRGFLRRQAKAARLVRRKGRNAKTLAPLLADSKRPKDRARPKGFQLLRGEPRHAGCDTALFVLLRPTTANHNFADAVMRQFSSMIGGGPGERAGPAETRPCSSGTSQRTEPRSVYEKSICTGRRCWRTSSAAGIPRQSQESTRCPVDGEGSPAAEKEIWNFQGASSTSIRRPQLAEILLRQMNLQPNPRRGKPRPGPPQWRCSKTFRRSIRCPRKSIDTEKCQTEINVCGCAAEAIHPGRAAAHEFFATDADGPAQLQRSESAEYSHANGAGREIAPLSWRKRGRPALRRLLADRTAHHGAFFERSCAGDAFRSGEDIHARTAQEVLASDARETAENAAPRRPLFRHHLWPVSVWTRAAARHRAKRSGQIY